MKIRNTTAFLLSFFAVLLVVACEQEEKVDISQLTGKWRVTTDDPRLMIDSCIEYTFNSDMTCSLYTADVLSDSDTTYYYTHVINRYNHILSFYDEEHDQYVKQYDIRKLNSKELRWKRIDTEDGFPAMYLIKITD